MAEIFTFKDGKLMFKDKIAYANGEYVSLKDYEALEDKNKKLKSVLDKIYNEPHETEKDLQQVKIEVIKSELEKALFNVGYYKYAISTLRTRCHESARDSFDNENYEVLHIVTADELENDDKVKELQCELEKTYNELMEVEKDAREKIAELESELEAKDNDSKRKDTEDYAKYNQITSGTYGLLLRKYKGKSRNDVILKFSEFINTLSENGIEVFDEAEGFVVEIKDDSLRSNDEIASLQKQIEKLESIRTRCHKSAMDSFDLGMYEFLHIVTADELKTAKDVNDRTVELPFDALETANMLINATYKRENCMTGKIYDKDIYDIDDLEQIAEHLLVYCKHHREDEE